MSDRASIFQKSALDIGSFGLRTGPDERPAPEQLDELTRGSKFRSRETVDQPREIAEPHRVSEQRRRRTGRNVQFNIRATQAVINEFKSISERQDWPDGLTLERALEALKRELAS
jgi:hypothetical protein